MKKRKGKSLYQWVRYASLLSVIGFFILVPLSNRYANYKISWNQSRLVELADGYWNARIYEILDKFYSLWPNPVDAATSNNGSLWAYTVLGVPLSDPLGLLSELINAVEFPTKYLIGGLIPFVVTLLLGRVFCSWICPMRVVFAITEKIRYVARKISFPLLVLPIPEYTRIILFWMGLLISHFLGAWIWHFILPYISFTHEIFSIVVFSSFTIGIYFLVAVIVLDIGLIPGQFCQNVCPTGFLLSWIGKFSVFKLKAKPEECPTGCRLCQKVCPYSLFPKEEDIYSCHLCFKCVESCPKQTIHLGVNRQYQNFFNKGRGLPKMGEKAIEGGNSFLQGEET